MIIEFIGTPGAGKTTLLPAVIEFLSEHGLHGFTVMDAARPYARRTLLGRVVNHWAGQSLRGPLLWQIFYHRSKLYRLRFFVNHPKLIWQVWSSQRRRPIPAEAQQHVLHWFFRLVGYYEFLTAHIRSDEALILDEGFIHRVVQMNASDVEEPNPDQIFAYVDLLPRPDLVIFPQAPWEVCQERIYQRGVWARFQHKSPAELARYVANSHQIVNLTVDYIKRSGWPVIEVDNGNNDLAASIAELRSQLARISIFAGEQMILQPQREGV